MQLLFDFFPIIVFFVAYKMKGILVATAAIMVAITIQIIFQWITKRTVSKMLLISGALALVFGGITLALKDPRFIQWKLTVVDGLFAIAFLGSQFIGSKTLIERVMGHAIDLPQTVWRQLNLVWVANFAIMAIANVYVIYHYSLDFWADFKVWGTLGSTLVVAVLQGVWIARVLPPEQEGEQP